MGGDFTLNVLNLSLLTGGAANSGLLELNLGRGGASMNFGTGGANVSIDNIASVMQGAQVWSVNNQIRNHAANNNFYAQVAMRSLHGFGDPSQQQLLRDILSGDVEIRVGAEGTHIAETVLEDGRRVIHITNAGYRPDMSVEEQMILGVILGHEAHRDGIVTADNYLETRQAVRAHTEMALRMIGDGQVLALNDNLINTIIAYSLGNDFFNAYVDMFFDSSADYNNKKKKPPKPRRFSQPPDSDWVTVMDGLGEVANTDIITRIFGGDRSTATLIQFRAYMMFMSTKNDFASEIFSQGSDRVSISTAQTFADSVNNTMMNSIFGHSPQIRVGVFIVNVPRLSINEAYFYLNHTWQNF